MGKALHETTARQDESAARAATLARTRLADGDARLRVLADASRAFATPRADVQSLLQAIAKTTAELIGDGSSITLLEPDGDTLINAANAHRDPALEAECAAFLDTLRISKAHSSSISATVVRTGEAKLVQEIAPAAMLAQAEDSLKPLVARLNVHSFAVVPILVRGTAIGTLSILRSTPGRSYAPQDLTLLQDLADRAGMAIDQARSLADATRMADRFRVVSEAGQLFTAATHDPRLLLDAITRRLSEVIGEGCTVRLLGEDGCIFEQCAIHHPDPRCMALIEQALAAGEGLGDGLMQRVAATREPLLVSVVDETQLMAEATPARRALAQQLDVGSVIAVPLIDGGKTIGAIILERSRKLPAYTRDDQQLVQDLARFAALTLGNSRLLASTQHALEQRERAEAELRHTEEQLREAQKMEAMGRLAGGVAHDFNNILSIILSYASMDLQKLAPNDPLRADLEQIQLAGQRAATLTRQLLAFSRRQVSVPRSLNLNSVIGGIDAMLRRLTGEGVELSLRLAPELRNVLIDPGQLEQVLMNLVVNACDAMPRGGTLEISTANADDAPQVLLQVRDTGVGIDEAVQARIFEPFFTTKEPGKGTGLGLSTAYGIVNQAGGTIAVESEPGRGTTFTIRLAATELEDAGVPASAHVASVRGSETILLVEDEAQLRLVAKTVLETHGYRVLCAAGGDEALLLHAQHAAPIHLLLTDVVMPQMAGPELVSRIVSERPTLRVLYMSGYADAAIVDHGVLAPGVELLEKPVTPEALLRRVRAVLDR